MELQSDLDCSQGKYDIKTPTPPWNFKLTWTVLKDKVISKFAPPWNFKLTWTVHKDELISKFAPPWNFKLTWTVYKGNRISKFPPGGPSNLPKDLIKIPTPMKLQIDMKCPHGENLFPSMQKLSCFRLLVFESNCFWILVSESTCLCFRILVSESAFPRFRILVSESACLCFRILVSESALLLQFPNPRS